MFPWKFWCGPPWKTIGSIWFNCISREVCTALCEIRWWLKKTLSGPPTHPARLTILFWVRPGCSTGLPRCVVGWSSVCDCGNSWSYMRGSRKLCQRGFYNDNVFFLCLFFVVFFSWWDGERIEMPPKKDHHRPASESPLKRRFDGVPIMAHHWMLAW